MATEPVAAVSAQSPAVSILTIGVVIPTKGRPGELERAVASVLGQLRQPDELVIVDQSPSTESRGRVERLFAGRETPRLIYVHDATIGGLVAAKQVGVQRASCEVVCFLEDDVIVEEGYVGAIELAFQADPGRKGCGGIIANPPSESRAFLWLRNLFFRGIFRDPRPRLAQRALAGGGQVCRCDVLSGGVSAWRREVFDRVPFDTENGFFMFEDMEFAARAVRTLGRCLYLAPDARLEHHPSRVNRPVLGAHHRRKLAEAVVFFRTRRGWRGARRGLALVSIWWGMEAVMQVLRHRSPRPIVGCVQGVMDGWRKPLTPLRAPEEAE
jgi:GT2 family glycosyltransferase